LTQRVEEVEATGLGTLQVGGFGMDGNAIGFQIVHNRRVEKGLLLMILGQDVGIDVASALAPAAIGQIGPVEPPIEDLATRFLLFERIQTVEPRYVSLTGVLG